MKTTIEIADVLLKRAKAEAARRGTTLRAIVEEALRASLGQEAGSRGRFRLNKSHFEGRGLQPGVRLGDWDHLGSLIYEGRGG